MKHEVALTGAYGMLLVVLGAAGALAPSSLNWGLHALGFLPFPYVIAFVVLGIGVIALGATGVGDRCVEVCANFLGRRAWLFLLLSIGIFVAAAALFRISVPLLGDSYLIVNNYQNTLRGEHTLNTYSEPLAMFWFYALLKLLGATESAGIFRTFFLGDLVLGIGFLINVFLIARRLFSETPAQLLFFGFLVCTSSLQLFFGYVESYPVVLYSLSLFVLAATYVERGDLPFVVVALAFLLQLAVHFLNILLLPLVLSLAVREYRERGVRNLLVAAGVAGTIITLIVVLFGNELMRFLPRFSHVHYLSVTGAGDEFQAYTIFSLFHFIDLANLAVLVMPFSFIFLAGAVVTGRSRSLVAQGTLGYALVALCVLCFLATVKYDLGMAKDWDIAATASFPLTVFVGRSLVTNASPQRIRTLFIAIALSALTAVPFFALNATVEPNIARFRSLLDDRIMSRESYYLALNHLSKYYYTLRDEEHVNELWEHYSAKYPADWRGYRGLVKSLIQLGDGNDPRIWSTFAAWMAIDPGKTTVRDDFLQYCLDMSQRRFAAGDAQGALLFNRKVVEFDSTVAPAWNNIGLALRAQGEYRDAVGAYTRAVTIDPGYVTAQINLGNVYDDLGNTAAAISWYERAIARDPAAAGAYFNLGIAQLKLNNAAAAISALQRAARLGEADAQMLLQQRGLSW